MRPKRLRPIIPLTVMLLLISSPAQATYLTHAIKRVEQYEVSLTRDKYQTVPGTSFNITPVDPNYSVIHDLGMVHCSTHRLEDFAASTLFARLQFGPANAQNKVDTVTWYRIATSQYWEWNFETPAWVLTNCDPIVKFEVIEFRHQFVKKIQYRLLNMPNQAPVSASVSIDAVNPAKTALFSSSANWSGNLLGVPIGLGGAMVGHMLEPVCVVSDSTHVTCGKSALTPDTSGATEVSVYVLEWK